MPNRLATERSPYLLQHAHNPVDWFPWCDEAFDKARAENRPVFLSIGYSACHWCHVMEHESFEDAETAVRLNDHFVSIKVDREERPDIDQTYQLAHQILTQRAGGWPLSMFLTPDRKPFFGGTYFPNQRRYGMPSFGQVLDGVLDAYRARRSIVDKQGDELVEWVAKLGGIGDDAAGAIDASILGRAAAGVMSRADLDNGGVGQAPKFPNVMSLELLFAAGHFDGRDDARRHALFSLQRMASGGIYDQLGGGFARYSTDERWLVPHFEKMLYDNALLARIYLDGWRVLARSPGPIERSRCRTVVSETLEYLLREMVDDVGALTCAQDADSEGEEGRFFVWTPAEVARVVGEKDTALVCRYFDVRVGGNFEHGRSVLWTPESLDAIIGATGRDRAEALEALARARAAMFRARSERVAPMRDDKCLANWNGLAIGVLADAGATLGETRWLDAATRALTVWESRAWSKGRLAHAMRGGEAYGVGFADDYGSLAGAALDVFEASGDGSALRFARDLIDALIHWFWDEATAMLYFTPSDGEVVLLRSQEVHDHAWPCSYGVCADALLRLATLTGQMRYRSVAETMLRRVASLARRGGLGAASIVRAADRAARGSVEIVIAGARDREDVRALVQRAREAYVPYRAIVVVENAEAVVALGIDPSLVRGRTVQTDGRAQAYVCRGTVCDAPVGEPEALAALLSAG